MITQAAAAPLKLNWRTSDQTTACLLLTTTPLAIFRFPWKTLVEICGHFWQQIEMKISPRFSGFVRRLASE